MPSLPTMSHSSIEIFERDGSVYNGMSYEARSIRLTFVIKKDNAEDYEAAVNDVKNTFATKEEAPLYLGKEDRYIWCVPIDDLYITEVGTYCATGEINLVAYDPYWYDNEILSANSETKTVTVDVVGDVETPPTIHIGVSGDASFYQIENTTTGEKILLGEIPRATAGATKKKYNTILKDEMETTSGWSQSETNIDSGMGTGGTLAVYNSGKGLKCGDFGSASSGNKWHGACYMKNLPTSVKDFTVRIRMSHNSTGTNGDPTVKTPYKNDPDYGNVPNTYYETKVNLNLRKSASLKAAVLTVIPKGTKLEGTETKGFLRTTYKNFTGYCSLQNDSYIKKYTGSSGKTLTQQNFVTTMKTPIRASAKKKSTNKCTIPIGTCIRCIVNPSYVDKDKKITYYKLAKAYKGITGYVAKANLVDADDYQIVYDEETYKTADDKNGICTLFGYSSDGTQLFSMNFIDDNNYYEFSYPLIRKNGTDFLKDKTKAPDPKYTTTYSEKNGKLVAEKKYKLSGTYGSWNDFYGELYIERKNNKWYAYVKKMTNDNVHSVTKTLSSKTVTDTTNSDKNLSYLVMYIGTAGDSAKACGMGISHIEVKSDQSAEIENPGDVNWQGFEEGDAITIDCANATVELNQIDTPGIIDVASDFFNLLPGENTIKVVTDDSNPTITVTYDARYL